MVDGRLVGHQQRHVRLDLYGCPVERGRAINWTNGAGQQPGFSNITLFARDTTVLLPRGGMVSAVPEPESYAMLIAALGMIGFMAHRKPSCKRS